MNRIDRMRAEVDAFAAGVHPTTTVLDRGLLDHPVYGPVPAVRTRNAIYGQTWVWAYTSTRRREKEPSGLEPHAADESYSPEH